MVVVGCIVLMMCVVLELFILVVILVVKWMILGSFKWKGLWMIGLVSLVWVSCLVIEVIVSLCLWCFLGLLSSLWV